MTSAWCKACRLGLGLGALTPLFVLLLAAIWGRATAALLARTEWWSRGTA